MTRTLLVGGPGLCLLLLGALVAVARSAEDLEVVEQRDACREALQRVQGRVQSLEELVAAERAARLNDACALELRECKEKATACQKESAACQAEIVACAERGATCESRLEAASQKADAGEQKRQGGQAEETGGAQKLEEHARSLSSCQRQLAEEETRAQGAIGIEKARTDAEKTRADGEKARADSEKARADSEKARADGEKARADEEKVRADAEKSKAQRLELEVKEGGAKLSELQAKLRESNAKVQELNGAVAKAQQSLKTVEGKVRRGETDVARLREQLKRATQDKYLFSKAHFQRAANKVWTIIRAFAITLKTKADPLLPPGARQDIRDAAFELRIAVTAAYHAHLEWYISASHEMLAPYWQVLRLLYAEYAAKNVEAGRAAALELGKELYAQTKAYVAMATSLTVAWIERNIVEPVVTQRPELKDVIPEAPLDRAFCFAYLGLWLVLGIKVALFILRRVVKPASCVAVRLPLTLCVCRRRRKAMPIVPRKRPAVVKKDVVLVKKEPKESAKKPLKKL